MFSDANSITPTDAGRTRAEAQQSAAIDQFRDALAADYGGPVPGYWEFTATSGDWTQCRGWHPVRGGTAGDVVVTHVGRSGRWAVEAIRAGHTEFFRGDVDGADLRRRICRAVAVLENLAGDPN